MAKFRIQNYASEIIQTHLKKLKDKEKTMNDKSTVFEDKRSRSRINIYLNVLVHNQRNKVLTLSKNISLKGILCHPCSLLLKGDNLRIGEFCKVEINLSPKIIIDFYGRIIRNDYTGMALDFLEMNAESFSHLLKLIRMNSLQPEKIDQELQNPAF